jgi:hypothetical protein
MISPGIINNEPLDGTRGSKNKENVRPTPIVAPSQSNFNLSSDQTGALVACLRGFARRGRELRTNYQAQAQQ